MMYPKYLLVLIVMSILSSCKKRPETYDPPAPPLPQWPAVLIKDVVHSSLPSPFYHFEYDTAGRVSFISYASDIRKYDIVYEGGRLTELRNNIEVVLIGPDNDTNVVSINKDRLRYFYDNTGRVNLVTYSDSAGMANTRINLAYDGHRLVKYERERKGAEGFRTDKIMTMTYYPDGNLQEITVQQPAIIGQNYTTRYEQYDNKINSDGFSLLHNEFFDHFVFLPMVQMQINNPGKEIRTGDGNNYRVDYAYTYNDRNATLTRSGDFLYTNGPNAGQRLQLSSAYSYYP